MGDGEHLIGCRSYPGRGDVAYIKTMMSGAGEVQVNLTDFKIVE